MYQLKYRKQARNYLARLPLQIKTIIIDKLHQIAADPDLVRPDIKILKGRVGYRLRIGQYRVIYTRHDEYLVIEIVKIRPRGDIYKGQPMEIQTIREKGQIKYVVLPIEFYRDLLQRLEDKSDLRAIRNAQKEPLYDQEKAETYIFMNPVKRERLEKGWTQAELAQKLNVKQSTVAKWERKGAIYRGETRKKFSKVFGIDEKSFS